MRTTFSSVLWMLIIAVGSSSGQNSRYVSLPTSKILSLPSPGLVGPMNGFAGAMVVSHDEHYAAILHDGYGSQDAQAHQSIAIVNLTTNQITDFPEDRLPDGAHQSYFIGLAFSGDGTHLYASVGSITDPTGEKSGDTGNGIAVYKFAQGKISWEHFLAIPPQKIGQGKIIASELQKTGDGTVLPYPAGLAVISAPDNGSDQILVADNYSDNALLLDSTNGHVLKQFDLSRHEIVPSSFPFTVVATRDGRRAWCSLWNDSRVAELDLIKGEVARWIPLLEPKDPGAPGSHPTAMVLSQDEKQLYIALANADRVAEVATDTGKLQMFFDTTLPGQTYSGTFPSALAMSADGERLFVADASLNAVAVFHTQATFSSSETEIKIEKAAGFLPTDWYPTALATVGSDLLIASSKGQGTGPNSGSDRLLKGKRHRDHPYIATLLYGSLARLSYRELEKRLPEFTHQVEENNLVQPDAGQIQFAQKSNPIRHVIYILKENRTYDQILGDLKVGDGDPALTMYGADVTPNEHKLALQFGVLDNFYDSGEVSGNGHNWSTAAITSDYNEHTWQIAYRSNERTYDFSGGVVGEYPLDTNQPDVDEPATGYIWDNLAHHGVTFRDYGEFLGATWCEPTESKVTVHEGIPAANESCPRAVVRKGEPFSSTLGQPHGSLSPWPWDVPVLKSVLATKAALRGHFDPMYPDFNTEYPDQLRADEFLNEFDGFVQARETNTGTELPAFVLLYLPNDHTHGTTAGMPRPAASVADNDLAVGRVVEAVSHSPYWDDTAIFILEDDAQDGVDHVDAHRSTAFEISKYSPGSAQHPFVDHHFYTTVNMIHTVETLLGLPPMNQNDGYAPLMAPLFTGAGDRPAFTADWSNRDNGLIYQTNPARGQGAKESAKMDFSRPDAANPAVLNAILWRDRKGNVLVPKVKHAVISDKRDTD